jgi:hypothetical protein
MKLLALLVLAACEQHRTVQVQLGPTATTITQGFQCREDADPTSLLVNRGLVGNEVRFAIVIDLVDLGGRFPGCRGEEIVASCQASAKPCTLILDNGRYCQDLSVARSDVGDLATLLADLRSQLTTPIITPDAPSQPVLIRAVASAQTCAQIAIGGFDQTKLIGCAYSCPVQLDVVDGPIALSLDVLDNACERQVKSCAGFL